MCVYVCVVFASETDKISAQYIMMSGAADLSHRGAFRGIYTSVSTVTVILNTRDSDRLKAVRFSNERKRGREVTGLPIKNPGDTRVKIML